MSLDRYILVRDIQVPEQGPVQSLEQEAFEPRRDGGKFEKKTGSQMNRVWVLGFTIVFLISCGRTSNSGSTTRKELRQIQEKYAPMLGVSEAQVNNLVLYRFIDSWWGTPYKYGGKDKQGIDCSSFTSRLQKDVFQKEVSGPSWSIAENCKVVKRDELREGDLVFFKIESKKISHVGVYLQNDHFVHASTSKGVLISCLQEKYYAKYLHSFGRPR